MISDIKRNERLKRILKAFASDDFLVTIDNVHEFKGKLGILPTHRTAINSLTGESKRVYYLEGTNYQMGYLLGVLAEVSISRMCTEFLNHIIPSLIYYTNDNYAKMESLLDIVQGLLLKIIDRFSQNMKKDVLPQLW